MTSHDELQEKLLKTCTSIKQLRSDLYSFNIAFPCWGPVFILLAISLYLSIYWSPFLGSHLVFTYPLFLLYECPWQLSFIFLWVFYRDKIHSLDNVMVQGPLKIMKITRTRNNYIKLFNKVSIALVSHSHYLYENNYNIESGFSLIKAVTSVIPVFIHIPIYLSQWGVSYPSHECICDDFFFN